MRFEKFVWFQYFLLKINSFDALNWKLPKLKFAKIESCQNWKLPKLKFAKIEICQNWKLLSCEFSTMVIINQDENGVSFEVKPNFS